MALQAGIWLTYYHVCEAQSSRNSYQHAMRDGHANQPVAVAEGLYKQFMKQNERNALAYYDLYRETGRCYFLEWAFYWLGKAYHSYSDSLSPAHAGFQPWWGPIDGTIDFGGPGYYAFFVIVHHDRETIDYYNAHKPEILASVRDRYQRWVDAFLKP